MTDAVTPAEFERRYVRAAEQKVELKHKAELRRVAQFGYPGGGSDADSRLEEYLATRASDQEFAVKAEIADHYAQVNWLGLPAGTVVRFRKQMGELEFVYAGLWVNDRWYLTGKQNAALTVDAFIAFLVKGTPVYPEAVRVLGWDGHRTLLGEIPDTIEQANPADLPEIAHAYRVHQDAGHVHQFDVCLDDECRMWRADLRTEHMARHDT